MTYNTINDAVTMPGGAEGALLAGRYRVVRQLGQGGMGSVWLAEDIQLDNKQFAIKMLPSILVSNKRAYRQLKDEALVAMKLVHPNIVTLRAFEENNGNPFLVMDYIDGETLDDYLAEKGKLSEDETIRLLRPIADALDYAHGEGVVHRDVKPANVMIRKDGHPYILDFGISREIQETLTRVTGKLSSGTLLYMSPEQLNGDTPVPAQDVYSFAVMAYECLKGSPPFVRGAIEDQIKNKIPEPPAGRGTLRTHFVAGIMAGLAKKREDRPPTCMAVIECSAASKGTEVLRQAIGCVRVESDSNDDDNRVVSLERVNEDRHAAALKAEQSATSPAWTQIVADPHESAGSSAPGRKESDDSGKIALLVVAIIVVLAGVIWWINARNVSSSGNKPIMTTAKNVVSMGNESITTIAKEDEAVLTVAGEKLMRSEVDADVEALIKAQGDRIPAEQLEYAKQVFRSQIVQGFIAQRALLAKAKDAGYVVTDADRRKRSDEVMKLLAQQPDAPKTIDEYFAKFPLGEKRAREEFDAGIVIDKMLKDEQAKAPTADYKAKAEATIANVISDNRNASGAESRALKKINDLKAQIDQAPEAGRAAKFAELAKANSDCPSSAKGGDLGPFQRGAMVPEFDKVAFSLPEGKVSDPVKTKFGYHLVLVTKRFPAVKAKDGKPAEPEKVQASHILVKVEGARPVPKVEDVIEQLKKDEERKFTREFVFKAIHDANVEALDKDYEQFIPEEAKNR